MKKLILSAAIILGSMSAFATILPVQNPQNQSVLLQEEYTEVQAEAVPQAIKTAMEKAYPGAILEKAYINKNKEYKLEITVGDQNATVYADAEGNWINK
ncbi:hypothetical protein [Flavobacterium sp. GSP6]|uniref:hypothetical protein n=1 Tax=Flavobacterium sp. GSP6 TaxID=2497488 RepID=UPI000F8868D5|nr:hypothetical protein [Flavobacterium sp. GSP6]RTZ04788.1 hypothetical protein EKM03_10710 [Flavobacterium sp. GSP6]